MNLPSETNATTNSSLARLRREEQMQLNGSFITTTSEPLTTTREHVKKPAVADASQLEQSRKTKQPMPNNKENSQLTNNDYLKELQKSKDDAIDKFNKCKLDLNQTCTFLVNNCIDKSLNAPSSIPLTNNPQSNYNYNCSYQYKFYDTLSNSTNRTNSFISELTHEKSECNNLALLEYSFIYNDTLANNWNVSINCFNLSLIEDMRNNDKPSVLKCDLRQSLEKMNSNENGMIKECDLTVNVCESNCYSIYCLKGGASDKQL
jgi:hypothetical protein